MKRMTQWQRWISVGLMGILFAQLTLAVPRLSLTADEPVYMGAGYAFLRSGDLRMATSAQHPPLMQELVALPLLLQPGPELEALEGWDASEMVRFAPAFVAWYEDKLDAATFAARLPVVMLTLVCAAFLFRWAADWFGPWGGIVALTLFALDPNILAHGTLATNDIGFAAFSFIAFFAATRLVRRWPERSKWWSHASWGYLILTGVALGATLGAKSSGFFTAFALAALFLLAALIGGEGRVRRLTHAVLQFTIVVGLGLLVLWASYAFEWRPFEEGGRPVPMATQWEVWSEMRGHLAGGHTSYLMGEISDTGWRAYYPLAIALKTPLVTLVLLALGLVAAVAAGPRRWLAMLPLWIFLGGYMAAAVLSTVNTGYRFLLPMMPFFFLLIAGLFRKEANWLRTPALRWGSWAALILVGSAIVVSVFPHYLTYFNLIAGGPSGGHRFLVDSNLDWGQSFKALRAYLDEHAINQSRLSHYTYTDPALYDVRYQPIAPLADAPPMLPSRFNPAPGIYAIGATTLQGVMTVDPDMYSWFRQQEPEARPGNAIFVFRVEEQEPRPTWVAQCTVPVAPLTQEATAEGFGSGDLRLTYFDCTQSWLYPESGETPGWYALHRGTALGEDRFINERLGGARLSYEQREDRALPAFVIYEQLDAQADVACSVNPQPLDGPLSFLGYTNPEEPVHPGDTVEIETCWQVTALPRNSASFEGARPLSLMLHLIGPGGAPVVVGDGLGVPVENWQVGDVIVQRHQLKLPVDAPAGEYALYSGAYWLDTLQRWSVQDDRGITNDRLELTNVKVLD
jgi:4-amino-4-deoxy-L-arabinose transferase-like glycosyltransferase